MLSLYFTAFWSVMRGADYMRPSALHRGYAFLWMYVMGWAVLVAATVFEDRFRIATGYLFVFLEASLFLATLITLYDMFALPKKGDYAQFAQEEEERRENIGALPHVDALVGNGRDQTADDEATETTPLVGGDGAVSPHVTTFANYARRSIESTGVDGSSDKSDDKAKSFIQNIYSSANITAA
jgi:hypothetical protein